MASSSNTVLNLSNSKLLRRFLRLKRNSGDEAGPSEDPGKPPFDLEKATKQHAAWIRSRKLCSKCKLIFQHWDARDDWESQVPNLRHHSLVGLQKSAQRCPTCQLLLDSLDKTVLDLTLLDNQAAKAVGAITAYPILGSQYDLYGVESEFETSEKTFRLQFECQLSDTVDRTIGAVSRRTNSEPSWKIVKKWFHNCENFHERCREQVLERKLPTRLVFVGCKDSELRLCLSPDLREGTKYLTLSHCWGTKSFTTLSSQNIENFLFEIPAECLTRTFKDAIVATRILGFQYIWIDSLCIKQNDTNDWKHEAELMEQVYANSSLNLAASDSPDGDTGCFFNRSISEMLGWKVQSSTANDKTLSETEVWDCVPYDWDADRFDKNALGKRAWVYQERFLSPRTLHFGAQELAWECRTEITTETFPAGFANQLSTTPGSVVCDSWREKNQAYLVRYWGTIIGSYSGGSLTVPTDKLVAISGIARLFASNFGITYLAGLWKEDLLPQLLWFIHHEDRSQEQRNTAARAPTWSWAATDSRVWLTVSFRIGSPETLATVTEVVVNAYPDPFVDFKDGFVRIKTPMFSQGSVVELQEMEYRTKFTAKVLGKNLIKSFVYLDYQDHDLNDEVFYLPILSEKQEGYFTELWGLVLQTHTSTDFKRVGAFVVYGYHIVAFQSALKEAASLDPHHFERFTEVEEDGSPIYTITII